MTSIQDLLEEAINTLPKTANEIADFLREREVKGQRKNVYSCPISNYVQRYMPTPIQVKTISTEIIAWGEEGTVAILYLPDPVFSFIDRFDHAGAYSFLVEPRDYI